MLGEGRRVSADRGLMEGEVGTGAHGRASGGEDAAGGRRQGAPGS